MVSPINSKMDSSHVWDDEKLDGEGPETRETGRHVCRVCGAHYDDPEAALPCTDRCGARRRGPGGLRCQLEAGHADTHSHEVLLKGPTRTW